MIVSLVVLILCYIKKILKDKVEKTKKLDNKETLDLEKLLISSEMQKLKKAWLEKDKTTGIEILEKIYLEKPQLHEYMEK